MIESAATIATMPSKKPGRGAGRPPNDPPKISESISLRVSAEMNAVLQAHVDSIKPKTTSSAVLVLALEEYLVARGLWPPNKSDAD